MSSDSKIVPPPLSLNCRVNRNYLASGRKAVVFVSTDIEAQGARDFAEAVVPSTLNISFSIDCSGSMVGEKIKTAKEAAIQIVDSLRPTDSVSVVRFASKAKVVIPKQTVQNRDEIRRRIGSMKVGTTTAMYAGIENAYRELAGRGAGDPTSLLPGSGIVSGFKKIFGMKPTATSAPTSVRVTETTLKEPSVSRIILLTDGQTNVGPTSESAFANLSKTVRSSGISITTLGIGEDYNEDLLTKIASASGGKWYHVTDVRNLPDIFSQELKEMKTIMLIRPELRVHLMSGAELSNIYRVGAMISEMTEHDFTRTGNDYVIPLEDVRTGQISRVVFKAHVPPKPAGKWRIARLTLSAPQIEIARDVAIESTSDQSLWGVETDPYPRALLMVTQMRDLSRKAVGDATVVKRIDDMMETVVKDRNMTATIGKDGFLRSGLDTVAHVSEQTKKISLTEEDKKRLKSTATVVRK